MLSKQSDKQAFIFLKDVRFADLKALVDYMYKGMTLYQQFFSLLDSNFYSLIR